MNVMNLLTGSYDYRLVALSIVLAVFASYAALHLARRFLDRFKATQKSDLNIARKDELHFQTITNTIPGMVWTARPDGHVDFASHQLLEYGGVEAPALEHWERLLHPDDVEITISKWEDSVRTGAALQIEYRLRRADGAYRWFLVRANPMRNHKGEIIKWFGTCTDIEDQKQNQQVLERQILERTTQLADTNNRLQEEMAERNAARRELDRQYERMMEDLRERSERATLLAKMGELLQSCINLDEVYAAALGFAPRIFPAVRGAMALLNVSRSLAEVIGSWSACQLPAKDFEPVECWALRTGHPHLVVAGDSTATCAHAAGVKNTYLCIPILAQGETLGILHLQATDEAPQLDASELSFKTTFAAQVGLSIANIRLREALRTQSVRDALTGLYNRRYLEEVLEREVRRAARATQSLGVLMIDLDHFKNFNDTFGHDAGDAVLRETGVALTRGIRAEDFVCRFGGEEFVVILPTANREAACARAERLRLKIKDLTILYQGRSMGMLTVSIGVAAFPDHGLSPRELMAAADAALYEAKRAGRDQVSLAVLKSVEDVVLPGVGKAVARG